MAEALLKQLDVTSRAVRPSDHLLGDPEGRLEPVHPRIHELIVTCWIRLHKQFEGMVFQLVAKPRIARWRRPKSEKAETVIRLINSRPIYHGGEREPHADAHGYVVPVRHHVRRQGRVVDSSSRSQMKQRTRLQDFLR